MRKFKKVTTEGVELDEVYCNMCKKQIKKDEFGKLYDYLSVDKKWGYLSSLDGQEHSFDLCDNCYKYVTDKFEIKALKEE